MKNGNNKQTDFLPDQGVRTVQMQTPKLKESTTRPMLTADMVRTYLHEIGRVPLLTHEQEIIYGKQVQKMMNLLEAQEEIMQKIGHQPSLAESSAFLMISEKEIQQVLLQGERAKRRMIEANLRLVVAIAKKYQKRNMEFLDLIQEGSLGLERGVEKFDPTKGYKFSTYAYWWIRQAITRAIAQQARTIRLPIHITEKLNKIKKTQRELSQQLGRSATPLEVANALELEPAQIREFLSLSRQPISLDVRVGDNQDTELSELLEDKNISPDDHITSELLRQDLQNLLAELTPQQREVISLRYGLEDGKELSLAKIGQRMSISRERVRQLEHQALAHLRRRKSNVRDYLAS
jgi:RNA polymerase nonessential primary-like sigma factor